MHFIQQSLHSFCYHMLIHCKYCFMCNFPRDYRRRLAVLLTLARLHLHLNLGWLMSLLNLKKNPKQLCHSTHASKTYEGNCVDYKANTSCSTFLVCSRYKQNSLIDEYHILLWGAEPTALSPALPRVGLPLASPPTMHFGGFRAKGVALCCEAAFLLPR